MKKFLVIYRMDMEEIRKWMQTLTKEQQAKDMAEWGTWMQANMSHFADAGGPVGKNLQVSASGSQLMSNDVAGYSIVQAENAEDVAKLIATGPHLKMPGATCDVMEILQMPGM
jgi:hypothetical protein